MRKLKKSAPLLQIDGGTICETFWFRIAHYRHNTSTTPYRRLMHSLASLIYGQNAEWRRPAITAEPKPSRAERRAAWAAQCRARGNA